MQGDLFSEPSRAEAPKPKPEPKRSASELLKPMDHAEREAAITDFERPIMLEAGAGTGKTATLVARIVCWCLGAGWEREARANPTRTAEEQAASVLAGIAAITFTEAAAAEMSTRVSEALGLLERASASADGLAAEALPTGLGRQHLPASVPVVHERARALRGCLEYLNISTIHSFCRRILASNPLEVGLAPSFEVDASGLRQREALRAAMESYLAQAWQDPIDPDLLTLARKRFGAPEIEETLLELLAKGARSFDFQEDPFDAHTVEALLCNLEAGAKHLASYLGGVFGGLPASQKVHDLLETLGELLAILSLDAQAKQQAVNPSERLEQVAAAIHQAWTLRASSKLEEYCSGKLLKGEEKLLAGESEPLFEAVQAFEAAAAPFRNLHPALLNSGRRVVHGLLCFVEAELRRRGVATFNDLLEDAQRLLLEHPAIAAGERRRMGMLMVDEFQDTDQLQCDLVRVLALEGRAKERPNLFIVGDPKQSIFSWRNADLAAYDEFKQLVQGAGGRVLQLTCNFRSTPAVLAEVTRVMQGVMLAEPGVQPPYVPLDAFRSDAKPEPGKPAIEHWISWPEDTDQGGIATDVGRGKTPSYRTEGRAIAADIFQRQQQGGAAWKDFALIFRSMTALDYYLWEFRRLGIPFEVQSDRSYYRRREIIDASALVRAALDPSDLLALVTLLRSPMVGLPDAALLPLWARGFPGQMADLEGPDDAQLARLEADLEQVAKLLPSSIPGIEGIRGWELSVMAALRSLAELRAAFEDAQHGPCFDAWIDRLRAHFMPDAIEAARYLGAYRLANLERFFDDLEASFEETSGDKQALLRSLRSSIQRNERVDARAPGDADAVKVLTIHSSKGLEFSQVYLPQLHKDDERGGHAPSTTAFDRRGALVSYEIFRASTPNRVQTEALRQRTERAERVRLFYVAMTRAKNRLVMLSGWGSAAKPKAWDRAKRYSELLGQRPNSEEALQALRQMAPLSDASAHIDAAGASWRLAALIDAGKGLAGPTEEPVRLPALALSAAKLRQLAQQRSAAEAYSLRPFSSPASAHEHRDASSPVDEPTPSGSRFEHFELAEPSPDQNSSQALSKEAALRVGTEVHRLLEHYRPGADLGEMFRDAVAREASPCSIAEQQAIQEILEAMGENGILERLDALAPGVLARELSVLLPPEGGQQGPSGFQSGSLDLLYRDAATGELVVVDYKTDRIQDEAELQQRAQFYRSQGLIYVRAIREALALHRDPRLEFWFLCCGRVVSLQD